MRFEAVDETAETADTIAQHTLRQLTPAQNSPSTHRWLETQTETSHPAPFLLIEEGCGDVPCSPANYVTSSIPPHVACQKRRRSVFLSLACLVLSEASKQCSREADSNRHGKPADTPVIRYTDFSRRRRPHPILKRTPWPTLN